MRCGRFFQNRSFFTVISIPLFMWEEACVWVEVKSIAYNGQTCTTWSFLAFIPSSYPNCAILILSNIVHGAGRLGLHRYCLWEISKNVVDSVTVMAKHTHARGDSDAEVHMHPPWAGTGTGTGAARLPVSVFLCGNMRAYLGMVWIGERLWIFWEDREEGKK